MVGRSPASRTARWFASAAWVLAGCGSGADPAPQASSTGADAGPPACGPLEIPLSTGVCLLVGVPPDGCGEGFVPDDGGCVAVLPEDACPPGLMAVPGETECRAVAPCGRGTWGDVPIDAETQHVDGAYAGGGSDGSAASPWTSIQDAVDAAAQGAVVAIAAGTYLEDVVIEDRPVRLWGRCPDLVEVSGTAVGPAAITIITQPANGTEVRDLAVRGLVAGIAAGAVQGVVIDRVWIHDTDGHGLDLITELAPTVASITGSLVENAGELAIFVVGANVAIDASVIRDTQPNLQLSSGVGVFGRASEEPAQRARTVITGSVLERNRAAAVVAHASDAIVERSVLRDTQAQKSDQQDGFAVAAISDPAGNGRALLAVRQSVLERNRESEIFVEGADATVEQSSLRATKPQELDGTGGVGVFAKWVAAERSTLLVQQSAIDDSLGMGVFVARSDVTVTSSLVRRTSGSAVDGLYGDGILVATFGGEANATISRSLVTGSDRAGVAAFGARVALDTTLFHCNGFAIDAEPMDGEKASFDDLGGNVCGCDGAVETCQAVSAGLAPPGPP